MTAAVVETHIEKMDVCVEQTVLVVRVVILVGKDTRIQNIGARVARESQSITIVWYVISCFLGVYDNVWVRETEDAAMIISRRNN